MDDPNNISLIESMTASGHLDSPAVQAPPSYESLGYSEPVNSVFNKVGCRKSCNRTVVVVLTIVLSCIGMKYNYRIGLDVFGMSSKP